MTIHVDLPETLEQQLVVAAEQAGLTVQDYVRLVLTADRAAATGSRAERAERADTLAFAAYRAWVAGGRSEEGSLSMDEVFE
jgi:hypothetical protein